MYCKRKVKKRTEPRHGGRQSTRKSTDKYRNWNRETTHLSGVTFTEDWITGSAVKIRWIHWGRRLYSNLFYRWYFCKQRPAKVPRPVDLDCNRNLNLSVGNTTGSPEHKRPVVSVRSSKTMLTIRRWWCGNEGWSNLRRHWLVCVKRVYYKEASNGAPWSAWRTLKANVESSD